MYKLFLTLRYLTRKKIVIFPILVVWLCLMMMIIVTSIMGGFVERVRKANRELLGDVVVSTRLAAGFPYYEELQDELRSKIPEIEASTPVARGYGLITFPRYPANAPAQVVGIDPAGRSKVSRFRENLYRQYISPADASDDLAKLSLPKGTLDLQQAARDALAIRDKQAFDAYTAMSFPASRTYFNPQALLAFVPLILFCSYLILRSRKNHSRGTFVWALILAGVGTAVIVALSFWPTLFPRDDQLLRDAYHQAQMAANRAGRAYVHSLKLPSSINWTTRKQIAEALIPPAPSFDIPEEAKSLLTGNVPSALASLPKNGCIVGVQFGLFERDARGNFDRSRAPDFQKVILTVVPISARGSVTQPNAKQFIMIDDSYSGVYDVDSTYVYAPFEVVQTMAGMRSELPPTDPDYTPPKANEILIKLKGNASGPNLYNVRNKIDDVTQAFVHRKSAETNSFFNLEVETWDQKQAKYLSAVQNEKAMQTFILGLMSCVVLVVIFLIFYMIVRDKTKDIGIIKAVGGSEVGVLTIFLLYGLFIGVVGGGLGVISGVAFVTHTNEIHEWLFQTFGIVIWDRSVYLFDRIPDTVSYPEVALYYGLAMLAGLIGAVIPALLAALQDPVRAVRYE